MTRICAAILLGTMLAITASAPAFADASGIVGADEEFHDAVAGVAAVARNAALPAEQVKDAADRAFGEPNAVKIQFKAQLRGWDFVKPAPDSPLTISNALQDARARLFERGLVLSGPLDGALAAGDKLNSADRVHFAPKGMMSPYEAGVFFYKDNDPDPGRIMINPNILDMASDADKEIDAEMLKAARTTAWIAAEATLVHESAHALAKAWNQLHPTKVIDGEVFAFGLEREFLRSIDPHGEGLATLISVAQLHQKSHPSNTATLCYQLSSMLGNLWRTDGKAETIKSSIVVPAGYTENKSVL